PDEADAVVTSMESTVGLAALGCLHLNDSKVPLGANRDRHANVGEGAIGEKGLGCLIAHPALAGRAAIMEVPGEGQGPRAQDIAAARRALDAGRDLWRDRAGAAAPTGRPPGRCSQKADVSTEEM
ncbi:MAG: TIM barrel protein, partial [Solirubrobacteraceae bacterium]